ncbi:MAG: NAD(P)H-hydrate dehydratase, partial [bacterium]|nr:NAD(P)H-hydrate dehydratase [bacterium]
FPAADFVGEVECLDIGIPTACFEAEGVELHLTEAADLAAMLPVRRRDAHKGNAGHLLIVGGSSGMTGAVLMAAVAALRSGAGKVSVAIPELVAFAVEAGPPEVMAIPLPSTGSGTVGENAFEVILEHAAGMNAVVVGPGLTTHPRAVELVQQMIQHIEKPMVLDADALNALSHDLTVLKGTRADLLLTPHPGEMARLMGVSAKEIQADRVGLAIEFATRHQLYIALKGAGTIIGTPGGAGWMNPTGNSAMASAGMGDVLAGVVGGLLSQSLAPEEALVAGVYLHGLAGDIAAHQIGGIGLTATDLLSALPLARQRVLEEAAS